ncbi:MAG: nucleoside triphosphate pyrophosphohydrolase [Candidatus Saelkia tenebricola]|nr:nucleoside triphosphate pyrophosphohydrolase [Candidatus Saelkia tenebricola]
MNNFQELRNIIKQLRSENGCAWDKEQNHKTLLPYLIEETYEIAHAIEENNPDALREELGDLLFIILVYLEIAEEKKLFFVQDVIKKTAEKMISRHPHVFSDKKLETSAEVLNHWHTLKDKERKEKNISILDNTPKNISALVRAHLIQKRASRVGFDWKEPIKAFSKVKEEINELEEHLSNLKDSEKIREEIGDLLFATVNVARLLKIDPEISLHEAVEKFIKRFHYIEKTITEQNKTLHESSLDDMEKLWQKSKNI